MNKTPDAKLKLRTMLRQRRNALDADAQLRAAKNLAAQIKTLPAFEASSRIALYVANDGEIDPAAVLALCARAGKICYAPVIIKNESGMQKELKFAEINPDTQLQSSHFGIKAPAVSPAQLIGARELDLVLLPLVGFDQHGNRIGMGGGFYDTTFAFKQDAPHSRPELVGLAHEIQRVENITADSWDIPIAAVVTDEKIYQCAARGELNR